MSGCDNDVSLPLLSKVGLSDECNERVSTLTGTQRESLNLCISIILQPTLMLVPPIHKDLLADIAGNNTCVLLTSYDHAYSSVVS